MPPKIFFGIELEFRLGYEIVPDGADLSDTPGSRTFKFHAKYFPEFESKIISPQIFDHVCKTFIQNGLHCIQGGYTLGDPDHWVIGTDASIDDGDVMSDYLTAYGIEITSPAYGFSLPQSLEDIVKACDVIRNAYYTDVNKSCGLHVHFSYGRDLHDKSNMWTFEKLRKLVSFFYAFERQFNTLHPCHRQIDSGHWTMTLGCLNAFRVRPTLDEDPSSVVGPFYDEEESDSDEIFTSEVPSPARQPEYNDERTSIEPLSERTIEGLYKINGASNLKALFTLVSHAIENDESKMAVSIYHIYEVLIHNRKDNKPLPSPDYKPTVEFRQHEGTLHGEKIVNWIKTLGGIILWLEEQKSVDFSVESAKALARRCQARFEVKAARLSVVGEEAGDDIEDDQFEVDILEDDNVEDDEIDTEPEDAPQEIFTIAELLEEICLAEQAEYYSAPPWLYDFVGHKDRRFPKDYPES